MFHGKLKVGATAAVARGDEIEPVEDGMLDTSALTSETSVTSTARNIITGIL